MFLKICRDVVILLLLFPCAVELLLADTRVEVKIPTLRSVRFVDDNHGWITGFAGAFHTKDGGGTWEKQPVQIFFSSAEKSVLFDQGYLAWADRDGVIVLNQRGFLVGDLRSRQWVQKVLPKEAPFLDTMVFADRQHGWGVSTSEILRTEDEGNSWQFLERTQWRSITAAFAGSSSELWLGEDGGRLLHTADNGQTWTNHTLTDSAFDIQAIRVFRWEEGWVCGTGSFIFGSRNGVVSWSKKGLPIFRFPYLRAISFNNRNEGWIVGSRNDEQGDPQGVILYTRDRGQHWELQKYDGGEPLIDVHALSGGRAWVIGAKRSVFVTTDHGSHWKAIRLPL